jgi:hypothetical protein
MRDHRACALHVLLSVAVVGFGCDDGGGGGSSSAAAGCEAVGDLEMLPARCALA